MIIKNHFHKKGFALGLVLKQRLEASRKWPIIIISKEIIMMLLVNFLAFEESCGF